MKKQTEVPQTPAEWMTLFDRAVWAFSWWFRLRFLALASRIGKWVKDRAFSFHIRAYSLANRVGDWALKRSERRAKDRAVARIMAPFLKRERDRNHNM